MPLASIYAITLFTYKNYPSLCLPIALLQCRFSKARHLIDIIWQLFHRSLSIPNAFLTQYLHNKPIKLHWKHRSSSIYLLFNCVKTTKDFFLKRFLSEQKEVVTGGAKKCKMTSNNKKIEKVFLHNQLRKCKCSRNSTRKDIKNSY